MKALSRYLFLVLSCCLLSLFFLASCTSTQQHSSTADPAAPAKEPLRVGVSVNAPPLAYKVDGSLQGLEIDLALQLGVYIQRDIRFVELRWDRQIPALEEGKIDIIMSGMTITSKRSYRVAFSKPYMRTGQILLVRLADARRYSEGITSLMGTEPAIGTITNTTGDLFITQTIARPNLVRFAKSTQAVKALIDGKIDAFVHDAPIITYYAAHTNPDKLAAILKLGTEEYLAWPVNKTNTKLLEQVNSFIMEKSADDTLQTTVHRWIPDFQ